MVLFTLQSDIPHLPIDGIIEDLNRDEDLISPDDRRPVSILDSRRQVDGELSDSDDEGEGGRRDHASNRELNTKSNIGDPASRKFGMNVGILTSASATTHGAGPSGNTKVARVLSNTEASSMDVDTPSAITMNGTSAPESATDGSKMNTTEPTAAPSVNEDVVMDEAPPEEE